MGKNNTDLMFTKGEWWSSGLEVGTVPRMDVKIAHVSGANSKEAKANAKLIAASPDLYYALEELVKRFQVIEGYGIPSKLGGCHCNQFIDNGDCRHVRAIKALEKARGS